MRCVCVSVIRIVCVVAALVVSLERAHAERRYALVIGANPGWSGDRPLRYAENDAERVRDVLVSLGGFSRDGVELLRDPDAADVRASLRLLARRGQDGGSDGTLVFLYYSGHSDGQYLHLRGERPLSHQELQNALRDLPATIRLAVIDACKSGAVTRKGGRAAAEFDVDIVQPRLSGMVVLTSSGADELSQESRSLGGSVFTHHLVSGLRGAADANADQRVTVAEAYHYAYERTRADTATSGVLQRPAFRYELSGQGELVLTELAIAGRAQIRIPRGEPRKYVILDAHEWRLVAEARSAEDRDVVLALAPGRYRIKRVLADRLEVASVALAPGDVAEIAHLGFEAAPLSAGIVKGDPGDLSPAERHEWERTQAFGVLADGQAQTSLEMFNQLVREKRGDTVAWRGRARALVRIAESYQRVNDRVQERRALAEALRSDPSLSNDPMFQSWYQRLGQLSAVGRAAEIERELERQSHPRRFRQFVAGIGFDMFSARGLAAVSGTAVLHRAVFSRLAFDIAGFGFDAALLVAPLTSRWSPYAALGGHVSLHQLGIGNIGLGPKEQTDDMVARIFAEHARLEVGAQYLHPAGFTAEFGVGILVYSGSDGQIADTGFPVIHFGWVF